MNRRTHRTIAAIAVACTALAASGCSSDGDTNVGEKTPNSLTLVAYDSFAIDPASFDSFTAATGIAVKIVTAGDTGTMLSKAELTAGNPEGDVMWGIDNTLLSRAIASNVFVPYEASGLDQLSSNAVELVPGRELTPVDEGDVCINYDIAWFAERGLAVPQTLDDLLEPEYANLLVVQNPATSSPGLAFLLATVAHRGADGWQAYWASLRANGVLVVDGWDQAYYEAFSGSSGKGPRPLVVSYGSSPPAEVIFADPRPDTAPTAVMASSCLHQVEFAGVLAGTQFPTAAGQLIDFLITKEFQEILPLTLFVYPTRTDAALPAEFVQFALRPADPLTVEAGAIEANSKDWIIEWTDIVLR